MSQYQRVEYLIGKNGKIVERVLDVVGSECVALTSETESNLGKIESRELLSSYYENPEQTLIGDEIAQVQSDQLL
ncbi:DUF2997 domain-containing protein [Pseudanabaena biceps]|nr:DUF2997 domain-containing protein [Pseudanabaena biceps]